jgi:hypothetical protein
VGFRKKKRAFLVVLFEHQSGLDRWMAFRLLRYMVGIWREPSREEPGRTGLSPILPQVFHQGQRRWKGSLRFASLLDVRPRSKGSCRPRPG